MSIQVENNLKNSDDKDIFVQPAHYIPCKVEEDGEANVKKYFEPYVVNNNGDCPTVSQISALEAFDCTGDSNSLASRWEIWKRALEIYFLATNVNTPIKKRALLLHTGGLALQNVYFNITGSNSEESNDNDVYKVAIDKLDEYFSPKRSILLERYLFRLIKQESEEKFEKFLTRLRWQCTRCNFSNENDNLIDQIVEKCNSTELREKILILGDSITIDKIIFEANALETVERQLNDDIEMSSLTANTLTICSRCGSKTHNSTSISCPAKDKTCFKCKYEGHFRKQCRTKSYN